MSLREGVLMHLDKQANGLIAPTGTFVYGEPCGQTRAMIRFWRRECALEEPDAAYKQAVAACGHDPYAQS